MTKIWLDDIRLPPEGWTWVKTSTEAMLALSTGNVEEISLDHDLGDEEDDTNTGYTVAKFIEKEAYLKRLPKLKWKIHSANPVGRKNMEAALKNADRYWNFIK